MCSKFPLQVFHHEIQSIIKEINKEYQSDIDSTACLILAISAFPLNNLYQIRYKLHTEIRPNLWLMNFQPSGSGKTPLLNMLTKSIREKQININELYNNAKFNADTYNMGDVEPKKLNLYLSSYTPEGMHKLLSDNCNAGKAVILFNDEISAIFKSFNQYNQGSGEEDFLQYFDYSAITKVRADRNNDVNISQKNVSIIGLTQPDKLYEIITQDRISNGNAFRWLYCLNEEINFNKNPFDSYDSNIDYMNTFYTMLDFFLDGVESNEINRQELSLSTDCRSFLKDWYDAILKKDFNIEPALLMNVLGKMDSYILKFAIVLNRIRTYFESIEHINNLNIAGAKDTYQISMSDIENAAILTEYFIQNTIEVLNKVSNPLSKVFKSEIEAEIFENIPDTFKGNDFINIYINKAKLSESTAKRRLKEYQKSKLIAKNKQGEYYKLAA